MRVLAAGMMFGLFIGWVFGSVDSPNFRYTWRIKDGNDIWFSDEKLYRSRQAAQDGAVSTSSTIFCPKVGDH